MADTNLPEGTDSIVSDDVTTPIADSTEITGRPNTMRDALKGGTDKLRSSASDRAMGFVTQGIERSSDALSNVSALIGDTAASIDERLGSQYGDYARSAASAIERAAGSLANKEPNELVDDARSMIRKSPGIALAGAAILGFALVRVVKSGLEGSGDTTAKRNK